MSVHEITTEGKTRKPRGFQTTEVGSFKTASHALGLEYPALSEAIGYSRSTYREWLNNGRMPVTAALACEALRRRNGMKNAAVVKVSDGALTPVSDGATTQELAPGIWKVEL